MGKLYEGKPLHWTNITKELSQKFKSKALRKFIAHFLRDDDDRPPLFGDELECCLIRFEEDRTSVRLLLKSADYLPLLSARWHWEVNKYAVESTPSKPYGPQDLLKVEASLRSRRLEARALLGPREHLTTISVWPRFGAGHFTEPDIIDKTKLVPMELVTELERYQILSTNLYQRGIGPTVSIPVFQDSNTIETFIQVDSYEICTSPCSLQATVQARNLTEARNLYDQLSALCPLLIALSAAAPAFRGLLLDTDCRSILQIGSEQNTMFESSGVPSRWSSVRHYISARGGQYNDVETAVNEEAYRDLVRAGVDRGLALHAAFRLNYDPVIVYDNNEHVDAAEVMNGTVWQLVKLKIPEDLNSWLIEVRMMDVQISDFENTAFILLVYFLSRAIDRYGLEFYVPVSELYENIDKSLKRDAVLNEKFMFRCSSAEGIECEKGEMSVDDIMNGNGKFSGLLHFLNRYLEEEPELYGNGQALSEEKENLKTYLKFLSRRASGKEPTNARRIRDFILHHPDYKSDSVICDTVLHDLMKETDRWER